MKKVFRIILLAIVVLSITNQFALVNKASAASLSLASLRLDRMAISTPTNVLVSFTPNNITNVAKLAITFAAGYTVSASPTILTTGLPAGYTAVPGTLTVGGSAQVVTIGGITTLTTATKYGVYIATGITTPASIGTNLDTITTQTSGAAVVESTQIADRIVTNDQIVVTATVPPTFNFTLSANTDTFASPLSTGSVATSNGFTTTIVTNDANGWIAWVKDSNQGLTSPTASKTIATTGSVTGTPKTLTAGTEGYLLEATYTTHSVTAGAGSGTLAGEYNGGANQGGTASATLQPYATSTGPTDGDVVTLQERAAISGLTKAAGDYTDTLTVIGAGNF